MNLTIGKVGTITATHGYCGLALIHKSYFRFLMPHELARLQGWTWARSKWAYAACSSLCASKPATLEAMGRLIGNGFAMPVITAIITGLAMSHPAIFRKR
jgi:hypothetical protein